MKNQRKIGIIIAYLSQFVQLATGFIYTPIMLRLLGRSEYGLYQLVFSVVSYLSLLSLGFGTSYLRFYSREKAKGSEDGVAKINGMFLLIFCCISFVCIACGVVMLTNIRGIFGAGLTESEYSTASVLMLLMIINLAMTFQSSVFECILISQERFLFQKVLGLAKNILHPFITLPLLIAGFGSVGMVTVTTVLTFLALIINIYYCIAKLHARFCFKGLKFSLLKEIWVFTFFIFLNQIVDQINWSVDKYLLGRLSGTAAVAVYGVGAQINTLYLQFSTSVSSVFAPKINRIVAETNDNNELTSVFTKVGRVQFIIMALILSGFTFFGRPFIKFWAGIEYAEAYYITLLLIFPVTVPLIQNLGIEIQRAKNKHQARSVVYFLIAIANIFLSISLIKIMGPSGAALGTTISLIAGNVLFMNWYYQRKLGININYFWKNIASFAPALLTPLAVGTLCMLYITYDSVLQLAICICLYTAVYCFSMYKFGMNREEREMIDSPIRKMFRR